MLADDKQILKTDYIINIPRRNGSDRQNFVAKNIVKKVYNISFIASSRDFDVY